MGRPLIPEAWGVHHGRSERKRNIAGTASLQPLAHPDGQRDQHGGGSEFPVRLDAFRTTAPGAPQAGTTPHPGHLHHLRPPGDLAGPLRGLAGGQVRPAAPGDAWGRPGGARLGREREGRVPDRSLSVLRACRARRRRRLWDGDR